MSITKEITKLLLKIIADTINYVKRNTTLLFIVAFLLYIGLVLFWGYVFMSVANICQTYHKFTFEEFIKGYSIVELGVYLITSLKRD